MEDGGNYRRKRERGMIQLGEERELSNCASEQFRANNGNVNNEAVMAGIGVDCQMISSPPGGAV